MNIIDVPFCILAKLYTPNSQAKITNIYTAEGLFDLLPNNYKQKVYAYWLQNIS